MAGKAFNPYSTISPWLKGKLPGWVPEADQERIASYSAYDQIYWNHNEEYKLVARGTEDASPIYVPRGKVIVETLNRYVGTDFNYLVDPEIGTPAMQADATRIFKDLFARERVISRYNSNKRFGLIRGDWLWHLMADVTKPPGTRLRLLPVDPSSYFPVYLDNDPERLHKVHLAERYLNPTDNKFYVRRLTYEKEAAQGVTGLAFTGRVLWSLNIYEETKWFKGDEKAVEEVQAPVPLDPRITTIPVFHIPNFDEPGNTFGSSELRGLERLIAALNQSYSDEDLTLALMGLGVYATKTTAPPRDKDGNQVPWTIYPGKVIQGAEDLRMVQGITSVVPYGDHIGRLIEEIGLASGATTAATGSVEVQVAESGVALALHLAPTVALANEKDQIIKEVMGQLFHNIAIWAQVYEEVDFTEASVIPTFGDKLPANKKAEVDLVNALVLGGLMSRSTARIYLKEKIGLSLPENEGDLVLQEMSDIAQAESAVSPSSPPAGGADQFADRVQNGLGTPANGTQADTGATPGSPV
jgi:hypothetical protein